jgi:predicted small secreted protein
MKLLKLKTLVMLLLFTTITFSQTLIQPQEITTEKLSQIMKSAYYDVVDVKDNYIAIKDGVKTFFDIDQNKRFISFSGNFALHQNFSKEQKIALMNEINTKVLLIKAYYKESNNSINFIYHFWIEGGFTDTSLVKAYKIYKSAFTRTLELDKQKIIK